MPISSPGWNGSTDACTFPAHLMLHLPTPTLFTSNESLRLFPPVASGSQRRVGQGGGSRLIGSQYVSVSLPPKKYLPNSSDLRSLIPEETQLFMPAFTLQRDPRNFTHPDLFLPERWLAGARMGAHNTAAFIPFSAGFASCVGKNLAMLEMRMLVSSLVQRFNFSVPAGELGREAMGWGDTLQDFFISRKGRLPALISSRK
jgi:hypothetical protein